MKLRHRDDADIGAGVVRSRLTPYLLAILLLGYGIGICMVPQQAGGADRPTVHVPHGWRSVSYGGVVLDVPGEWATNSVWNDVCQQGPPTPTVRLGPPTDLNPGANYLCPAITNLTTDQASKPEVAVVNVGADVHVDRLGRGRASFFTDGLLWLAARFKATEINGLRLDLDFLRLKVTFTDPWTPGRKALRKRPLVEKLFVDEVLVHMPSRQLWIAIEAGTSHSYLLPGGAPGRAMQIVHSIRLS
jgi:hypothetical protein